MSRRREMKTEGRRVEGGVKARLISIRKCDFSKQIKEIEGRIY